VNITSFESLACPLDGNPLQRVDKAWRCPQGHSFDIARQGYVHLLPVQKKRSKDPGDSKTMVAARQRFLEAGYYRPIADAVSAAILNDAATGSELSCLDAGCGEGYYLRQLRRTKSHYRCSDWTFPSGRCWRRRAGKSAHVGWLAAMLICRCCRLQWTVFFAFSDFRCIRSLPGLCGRVGDWCK